MRSRVLAVIAVLFVAYSSPALAFSNSVWVPPWDANALSSVQQNASAIAESNPVWYAWNADGSIAKNWNSENASWRAAMSSTRFMPTVQNVINKGFNGTLAATVFANAVTRDAHAESLATLAIQNAFDGIDIDYESLPATSRADFTAFVNTLGAKLHAANKKLSVTVHAKTSDKQNWKGPGAQDWVAIGQVADSVKIMVYDFHWSTSEAGAITPLDWLDAVATYARATIPNQKIFIGLPFYGYDWVGSVGSTANFASATQMAQSKGATISRDVNGEPTYSYNGHVVYFQDAESYGKKVALLQQKHASIGGVAHWAVGQEDPAIWNVMRGNAPTPPVATPPSFSSPAAPAAADFTIAGSSLIEVTQGQQASASYRLVAINGFSSQAAVSVQRVSNVDLSAVAGSPVVTPAAPVTVQFAAPLSTTPGAYQVSVRFTSANVTHEQLVTVVVAKAAAPAKRRATR